MSAEGITYQYSPAGWNQEQFLALGGFTVVFLNYNKAAFIKNAVAAVLGQDYPLLEMFFMDDASTDGSGDVMETLVRAYNGRHKVTVVRNSVNRHITGQWNLVAGLASGHWFGMFCADDIAYANRVTLTAQEIAKYPDLLGISCSGVEVNYITGSRTRKISTGIDSFVIDSAEPVDSLVKKWLVVVGATAFWHRSLFDKPLPQGPMDDEVIFYRLLTRRNGRIRVVYKFAADVETISYAIGTGISTEGRIQPGQNDSRRCRWIKDTIARKRQARLYVRTWTGILQGVDFQTASNEMKGFAVRRLFLEKITAFTTLTRLGILPALMVEICRRRLSPGMKVGIVQCWFKKFLRELLGLHVAALGELLR